MGEIKDGQQSYECQRGCRMGRASSSSERRRKELCSFIGQEGDNESSGKEAELSGFQRSPGSGDLLFSCWELSGLVPDPPALLLRPFWVGTLLAAEEQVPKSPLESSSLSQIGVVCFASPEKH